MKVTVYKNDLLEALKFVTKCAAVKPLNPITAAIKIDATDSMLTLTANNFTTAAWIKIPANGEENGSAAVDAKNFLAAASKFGDDVLTLETDNGIITAHSSDTTFTLKTFDANEFPAVTKPNDFPYEIRAVAFRELVQKTAFAVSNKDERPIFRGVNLQFIDDNGTPKVIALATNTYHIVRYQCIFAHGQGNEFEPCNVTVPASSLKIVADYLNPKDTENKIKFATDGKIMSFAVNNIYLQTRLLEGEFPPADHMFNREPTMTVRFNRADLKRALDAVSFVAAQTDTKATLFHFTDGELKISAMADDIGSAETSVQIAGDFGNFVTAFDGRFIGSFLSAVGSDRLVAEFTDGNTPAKFHAENDRDFDYLCTPIRMQETIRLQEENEQ